MHQLNTRIVLLLCSLGVSFIAGTASAVDESVGLFEQAPVSLSSVDGNVILIDFGRVAFGNVQLTPPENAMETITVHFGEKLKDGRVDRQPPGTVRYNLAKVTLQDGSGYVRLAHAQRDLADGMSAAHGVHGARRLDAVR